MMKEAVVRKLTELVKKQKECRLGSVRQMLKRMSDGKGIKIRQRNREEDFDRGFGREESFSNDGPTNFDQ